MLFVSYDFVVFFLIVFTVYHLVKWVKIQNIIVFCSSCVFYAYWSWKFLLLMLGLSITGYAAALLMNGKSTAKRLAILWGAIVIALGCLCFFKYSYFIYNTGLTFAEWLGFSPSRIDFSIVLPIAISFHTFQLIAYVVDVYRLHQKPEYNLLDFMAFSFFSRNY